ncbi:MAG: hypothetical protein HQM10_26710 [Candidatus Riflebacteria bacterium]|nr:hypothetical protein [Candidatus Riflebacteria bacterium]
MLRKLSLDQTKIYEQTIATYEIAKMLVSFIKGQSHYLSVGAEQGDVDTWDDLVIQDKANHNIHIQIKRQNTDFSEDSCIRDTYTQHNGTVKLRDLSTIDKSMKALAEWIHNHVNDLKSKEFHIELPTSNIQFKKGLTVRHFKELIEVHYKPDVTTSQGLEQLANLNSKVKDIYYWLTTWCSFSDWDHILKLLSVIKIKDSGTETDIEARTNDLLSEVFSSNSVDSVKLNIKSYISANTTFTGAIQPRNLLYNLKEYLKPNVGAWTQYSKDGSFWNISGINDMETNQDIERPSIVVPQIWGSNLSQGLKVNFEPISGCKITDSLLRMIIHQSGTSNAHCQNKDRIKSTIDHSIGQTLGISQNDTDNISIVENTEIYTSSEFRRLINRSDSDNCSCELEKAMNIETWKKVSDLLDGKIYIMENKSSTSLRDKLEERWVIWRDQLKDNHKAIGILFKSMLHPVAEGQSIKGTFRVGPKTAEMLSESLFLLLIISISLDPDNAGNWNTISTKYNMVSIGLKYWSGKAESIRGVRNIDEDGIIIAGRERANVIIFSNVNSSPNELMDDLIDNSNELETNTIASGKTPELVISNCKKLRKLINQGDFAKVQEYIQGELKNTDTTIENSIREATE